MVSVSNTNRYACSFQRVKIHQHNCTALQKQLLFFGFPEVWGYPEAYMATLGFLKYLSQAL